jgi:hypothetical protein
MIQGYWQTSRAPRYSLLFALPLLLLYQVLAAIVPADPAGIGVRNGADVVLQAFFTMIAGAWGPRLFMLCLVIVGIWLMAKDLRAHRGPLSLAVLGAMLVESVCLALIFGIVVGGLTTALLGSPPTLMVTAGPPGPPPPQLDRPTMLMLSLGAGIYEELLFRVVLVGFLAWVGRRLLGWRPLAAGVAATILGALMFSAFHYIGPYGDTLDPYSFTFRTLAGLFFSGLYLARGFGITAWTHALYDVFLLVW